VRALSLELKVNPNTAQRIVALLTEAGLLAVEPGIGTVVTGGGARGTAPRKAEVAVLGDRLAEPLVVEARRLGLGLTELVDLVRDRWKRLTEAR
jgi:GntR family transcriptional regulator